MQEALEEQVVLDRVDPGDAEHVGHDRVRRAAPALTGHPVLLREPHQVPVDEEELGQPRLVDHVELLLEPPGDRRRDRVVALPGALLGEPVEVAEGRLALGDLEAGEADAFEVEADLALLGDLVAGRQSVGVRPQHRPHLGAVLEEVFRVRLEQGPGLLEGHPVADRDQHVLERPSLGQVVVDVVGGDRTGATAPRQLGLAGRQPAILGPEVVLQLDQHVLAAEHVLERLQPGLISGPAPGQAEEVLVVLGDPLQGGPRLTLGLVAVGVAQEPGEVGPPPHRLREQDEVAAADLQLGADDGPDPDPPAVVDELDDAVDPAVVGDPERGHPELGGALDELLGVAGAVQEGVVGVTVQLHVWRARPDPHRPIIEHAFVPRRRLTPGCRRESRGESCEIPMKGRTGRALVSNLDAWARFASLALDCRKKRASSAPECLHFQHSSET